jgi:hypothetical protein
MIKCEICNKEYKMITKQHLQLHDITTEQYKQTFPNAKIICDELKDYRKENCLKIAKKNKTIKCPECGKDHEILSNIKWHTKILYTYS